MGAIEDVKQRLDIVDVAGSYTRLAKSGKNFKGICPFHQEKHGSFFVFPDRQSWHCFGACSTGGDVFSLVMKKEGLDFSEALKLLASRAGIRLPEYSRDRLSESKNDRLYKLLEAARDYYHGLLLNSDEAKVARSYVNKRGLSSQSLLDFKIGYSPLNRTQLNNHLAERGFSRQEMLESGMGVDTGSGMVDRFHGRLMFPINDPSGRVVGFGGREMDGTQPKYVNCPQTPLFDKGNILYGLDLARSHIRQEDSAVIVEGYMDVIVAHQYGFANTIASMGTAIGEKHVHNLKRLTQNIILAMDSDEAGEKAMLRFVDLENLLDNEVRVVVMPAGLDPDQVIRSSPDEWSCLLDSAQPFMDWVLARFARELDLRSAAGKTSLVDKIGPAIAQMTHEIRQAHYLEKLSRLVNTPVPRLEAHIKSFKIRTGPSFKHEPAGSDKGIFSNPREEYLLTMLLGYPELRQKAGGIKQEYFKSSENGIIFSMLMECRDASSIKDNLNGPILDHLENLSQRTISGDGLENKLKQCILLLEEEYLRNLLIKQQSALESNELTVEARDELTGESMEITERLRELFDQKSRSLRT